MEYLKYIAIGYYCLVGFKVACQLWRVRYNLKDFYDERMSLLLGVFVLVHITAGVLGIAGYVITSMIEAKL